MPPKGPRILTLPSLKSLLEAPDPRIGQSGLFSHASKLYHETSNHKRKSSIGKACLQVLLEFLVNEANDGGLRRWTGVLLRELCEGNGDNIERLILSSEEIRRKLGYLVLQETSELTRLICGQIIRTATAGNANVDSFWPRETDPELYKAFPSPQKNETKWNARFSDYMDDIWEKYVRDTDGPEQLYYVQNIRTTPELHFGNEGHNLDLSIGLDHMVFWSAANPGGDMFEQCLEIPLKNLTSMAHLSGTSQIAGETVSVKFEFGDASNRTCYFNCAEKNISSIVMDLKLVDCQSMGSELKKLCPLIELGHIEQIKGCSNENSYESQTAQQMNSQNGLRSSRSEDIIIIRRGAPSAKVIESIDSDSITSSNTHDIPTPNPNRKVAVAKQKKQGIAKYSLKAKAPLSVAVPSPKNTTKPQVDHTSKSTVKKVRSTTNPNKDVSTTKAIPDHAKDIYILVEKDENCGVEVKKSAKPPTAAASTKKVMVRRKVDIKPVTAISGRPGRGQRSAAVRASQHLREVDSDASDIEEAALIMSKVNHGENNPIPQKVKQAGAKDKLLIAPSGKPSENYGKHATESDESQIKTKADEKGFTGNSRAKNTQQDNAASAEVEDLYSASPDTTCKIASAVVRNTDPAVGPAVVAQNGDISPPLIHIDSDDKFTSKPEGLLGDIDDKIIQYSDIEHVSQFRAQSLEPEPSPAQRRITVELVTVPADREEESDKENNTNRHKEAEAVGVQEQPCLVTVVETEQIIQESAESKARQADELLEVSTHGKKRQASLDEHNNVKRHKVEQVMDRSTPLRRSPRLQERAMSFLHKKEALEPPVRATERKIASGEIVNLSGESPSEITLVDDNLARKQPIISFGIHGARNQGLLSSTAQIGTRHRPKTPLPDKPDREFSTVQGSSHLQRKKASIKDDVDHLRAHPMKRRSMSPKAVELIEHAEAEVGKEIEDESSPQQLAFSKKPDVLDTGMSIVEDVNDCQPIQPGSLTGSPMKSQHSQGIRTSDELRHTSQPSRVDENGSPIAQRVSQVDHIGRARQKLLDHPSDLTPALEAIIDQAESSAAKFGSKIQLGSIHKVKIGRPDEVVYRFIPHKKTISGAYESIIGKAIIVPEKDTVDPIDGGDLRITASKLMKLKMIQEILEDDADLDEEDIECETVDDGNTLVKELSIPLISTKPVSEIGNVAESRDVDRTSVRKVKESDELAREHWNVSLRPHYSSLLDAVHRIADEVVIRIAREEDMLSLLIAQYREGGNKLLAEHHNQRSQIKAQIEEEIACEKNDLSKMYAEAQGVLNSTMVDCEKDNLVMFEEHCKRRQEHFREFVNKRKRE